MNLFRLVLVLLAGAAISVGLVAYGASKRAGL